MTLAENPLQRLNGNKIVKIKASVLEAYMPIFI